MRVMNIEMKQPPYYGILSELAKKNNLSYSTYVRILNRAENNRLNAQALKEEFILEIESARRLYDKFQKISKYLTYKEFQEIYKEISKETGVSARCIAISLKKSHSRRFMKEAVDKFEKLKVINES